VKIPERYLNLNVAGYPLNLGDSVKPEAWPEAGVFAPVGFIQAFTIFDIGNGDLTGFYWPIGKESNEPLVCEFYHDDLMLQPTASNLEGFIKLKVAGGECEADSDDFVAAEEISAQLGFDLPASDANAALFPASQVLLDPSSPSILKAAAEQAMKDGELELAATHLEHALQVLPEYTEALFLLGNLYCRQRKLPEAAQKMIEVLSTPLCFGIDRQKALHSVKRLKDEDYPELSADPLWSQRHKLTFATGVKHNDDFDIYEEAVAEYLRQGKGVLAVRLRTLVGELMWSETVSFRERYGYTLAEHRRRLRAEIEQAGLTLRLIAVAGS